MLSLFIYVNSSFAIESNDIPDQFNITEHWISLTTSYDIETKTRKLGTLYRKFFSFLLTYEFFDPFDNKLATARARFFSFTAHFDVYDNRDNLLGMAEEKFFTFFPTFDIYGRDGSTKLARASMNFWGTTFTIYDPLTEREMAQMHRPFFRLKNDWTISITNRQLLNQKNIDFRLLMTVLAFQGDKEYWDSMQNNSLKQAVVNADKAAEISPSQIKLINEKVDLLSKNEGLGNVEKPDEKSLEAVAKELESDYNSTHVEDDATRTAQEKANDFTDYCLNLVQSNAVSDSKKKAILFLLKMRLQGGEI